MFIVKVGDVFKVQNGLYVKTLQHTILSGLVKTLTTIAINIHSLREYSLGYSSQIITSRPNAQSDPQKLFSTSPCGDHRNQT